MEKLAHRYPNFFVIFGDLPTVWQNPQNVQKLLEKGSAIMRLFLEDEEFIHDLEENLPDSEAPMFLEFAKSIDSVLSHLLNMFVMIDLKNVETDLHEAIQDFLALTKLYVIKNKQVIDALAYLCLTPEEEHNLLKSMHEIHHRKKRLTSL